MHDAAIRACLHLHRNPELSPRTFAKLLTTVASPEQLYELERPELDHLQLSLQVREALKSEPDPELWQQLERDWASLQTLEIQLVTINCDHYPALLKEIADPPALLYVRGNIELLNTPQLAMVGSRRSSRQGAENARFFSRQLAESGFTVTSGLALGIDAESHRGALEAGGNTIAVLGTAVDIPYPRRNSALLERIAEVGTVVSEFPLGTGPRPGNFPVRNRIISGMSLGVLVVEGAPQSGSLITARCAIEQGREVFAIPGSIHSPGSRGCHQLIRQGATLVETTGQILAEFNGWLSSGPAPEVKTPPLLEEKEAVLLAAMGYDPVTIDTLYSRTGKAMVELLPILMGLELKGIIESQGGCYQRLCSS